jgi:hypothetical protein
VIHVSLGLFDFVVYHVCRNPTCGPLHEQHRSKNPLSAWRFLRDTRRRFPYSKYVMRMERPQ